MRTNTLVVLIAIAILGGNSIAMARSGGRMSVGHSGHMGHFNHQFLRNHFLRNQAVLGGWGWGWDWGWPYGDSGYSNTTVVFPQATPQAAGITASTTATPCHWGEDTFTVPSSAGGTRPVQVMNCR